MILPSGNLFGNKGTIWGDIGISKKFMNKIEISEKEKKYRNLLGLKSRGVINVALLKSNFEERAKNYSDSRLEGMNAAKRRQALEKKDRLDRAYEYLVEQASK